MYEEYEFIGMGWDPQLSATRGILCRRHVDLFQHPRAGPAAAAEYQSHGALQSTATTEEPGAITLGGA